MLTMTRCRRIWFGFPLLISFHYKDHCLAKMCRMLADLKTNLIGIWARWLPCTQDRLYRDLFRILVECLQMSLSMKKLSAGLSGRHLMRTHWLVGCAIYPLWSSWTKNSSKRMSSRKASLKFWTNRFRMWPTRTCSRSRRSLKLTWRRDRLWQCSRRCLR